MKSDEEFLNLAGRYLDGQATAEEAGRLEARMMADADLRADFLACARVDAALRTAIGGGRVLESLPDAAPARRMRRREWLVPLAAAATVMIGAMVWHFVAGKPPVVARFAGLEACRWMDPCLEVAAGDAIRRGERIGLSAGRAELRFDTGALVTVHGPAILEARSGNGGFLILGRADLVAGTEASKGFVLETPTSKFVDIGTAFSAGVAADGLSRLEVTEGIVDLVLAGQDSAQRLHAGEVMLVEPGERRILTRIEVGDGTAAFRFPTIPPPRADDYADRSRGKAAIRVTHGRLGWESGRLGGNAEVLLDGAGQSKQDSPRESAYFFPDNEGGFLIDLGEVVPIRRIHTYSWHQHEVIAEHRERAQQRYTLYGYAGDGTPDLSGPPTGPDWIRIARVDSDESLRVRERLDRPAQQACAIAAEEGDIGRFRYLLWEVHGGTFYGEIDIEAATASSASPVTAADLLAKLPPATDPVLRKAAETMKPFPLPEGLALRGDGPQFLIWLPPSATPEIDLSVENGMLEVLVMDPAAREWSQQRERIRCGGMVFLPVPDAERGDLYWLRPASD